MADQELQKPAADLEGIDLSKQAELDVAQWIMVLMNRIMVRAAEAGNQQFQKFGFNIKGSRVLITLMLRGALRVSDLGEDVALDSSTLSHLLRRLERDGFIKRKRLKDDNRAVEVSLTKRGQEIAKYCYRVSSNIESYLLRGFTDRHVEEMRNQLLRMCDNLDRSVDLGKVE